MWQGGTGSTPRSGRAENPLPWPRSQSYRPPAIRAAAAHTLKAPIGVIPRNPAANALVADILEEASPHNLADFGLVIGDQILRDAPHDLGDALLPLLVPVGHLDLTARQADDPRGARRAGHRDREVLNEGM